jgi:hypothetical protein
MTVVLFVQEHTVPRDYAVGFPGGRTVSSVPLHYLQTGALGLSTVRRKSVAVIAACREQVKEDRETRSEDEDGLTRWYIAKRCLA